MGDDDTVPNKVKGELALFAAKRGITKYGIKIRTVTSSVEATVRDSLLREPDIVERLDKNAKVLGVLQHLLSVYLNCLVDSEDLHALASDLVFDSTVLYHLLVHLTRSGMRAANTKSPRKLDLPKFAPIKAHVDNYTRDRIEEMPAEQQVFLKTFPKRPARQLCRLMVQHMKRHVTENFQEFSESHFECLIQQRLWHFRDQAGFKSKVELASKSMFRSVLKKDDAAAESETSRFCSRQNLPSWKLALLALCTELRPIFGPLRERACPGARLKILHGFRSQSCALRRQKEIIWNYVNDLQPKIAPKKTDGVYSKENLRTIIPFLRSVEVPAWLLDDNQVQEEDVLQLVKAVQEKRKDLWNILKLPGLDALPKSFTLLPYYRLQHAFVPYDSESIRVLALGARGVEELLPADARNWWTTVFDFHSRRYSLRHRAPRTRGRKRKRESQKLRRRRKRRKKKNKSRKVLRQGRRFRKGIPICVKDSWVAGENTYEQYKEDVTHSVPWLVSSITSDGLQVKVVLATIVKQEHSDEASDKDNAPPPCAVKDPLPPGVAELVQKGYAMDGLFDPEVNSKGLFQGIVPIGEGFAAPYQLIGVDPGQINVATMVRREAVVSRGNRHVLANILNTEEAKDSSRCFTTQRYRYESLARFSEKWEARRRTGVYKEALESFSQVSLKKAGGCVEYAKVVYRMLPVMMEELLSRQRRRLRFTRFRARARNLQEMAKSVAYGAEMEELRATPLQGQEKRELKQFLFSKKRVVFFGQAKFGHGPRGPCPRKKLLRALSLLCPVVLVDEWRTSKCCKNCGSILKTTYGSRVFRCDNNQAGAGACTVGDIDRDTNAAANIGTCGVRELLGIARPLHLTPPPRH